MCRAIGLGGARTRDCKASHCSCAGCAAVPQHNGSDLYTTASRLAWRAWSSAGRPLQTPAPGRPAAAPQTAGPAASACPAAAAGCAAPRPCRSGLQQRAGGNMLTFMQEIRHGLRCTAALPLRPANAGVGAACVMLMKQAGGPGLRWHQACPRVGSGNKQQGCTAQAAQTAPHVPSPRPAPAPCLLTLSHCCRGSGLQVQHPDQRKRQRGHPPGRQGGGHHRRRHRQLQHKLHGKHAAPQRGHLRAGQGRTGSKVRRHTGVCVVAPAVRTPVSRSRSQAVCSFYPQQ